jgi:hypothetical protein
MASNVVSIDATHPMSATRLYRCHTTAEMASDPDAMVRAQVLHTICDGTPPHLEERVRGALEVFNRDSDPSIRRTAHKVMAVLLRTSKWNVL